MDYFSLTNGRNQVTAMDLRKEDEQTWLDETVVTSDDNTHLAAGLAPPGPGDKHEKGTVSRVVHGTMPFDDLQRIRRYR